MQNRCFNFVSLFLFLAFVSGTSFADSRIDKIDSVFTELQQNEGFNGNVLIYEDGRVLFEKSFGFKDYNTGTRLDSKSLFKHRFRSRS